MSKTELTNKGIVVPPVPPGWEEKFSADELAMLLLAVKIIVEVVERKCDDKAKQQRDRLPSP